MLIIIHNKIIIMTENTKPFTELKEKTNKKNENEIKIISLIKINNAKNKKFLGIKRYLFKKFIKKKGKEKNSKSNKNFTIAKAMDYLIKKTNSTNSKVNENICIICLEKITLDERHYLHCGHCFHCCCINKWINMNKNKCPICKQIFECNRTFSEDSIYEEVYNNNNNDRFDNRPFQEPNYSIDYREFLKFYFWIIILFFMFRGFCLRA